MSHPLGADEQSCARRAAIFGAGLPLAERYAALLRGDGVAHGHLGPREADRLWDRHLLNCAIVTDLVPAGARVLDVGSGAGLPGLAMAIRRPDLHLTLLEPMQRRVVFLQHCVTELGLQQQVEVARGRAGDTAATRSIGRVRWMTARAVAPLDRLVGWCRPLLAEDGVLLALKGERAQVEVEQHRAAMERVGMSVRSVEELPAGDAVTRVVMLVRRPAGADQRTRERGGGR